MIALRTEAEVLADIATAREALRDLALTPMSGREGTTAFSNVGRSRELRAYLSDLYDELELVRNGMGVPTHRRVV